MFFFRYHLRTKLQTDFDGTWSNFFEKSRTWALSRRFFQFLPHFFPKRQKIYIWISEMSFFMLFCIFWHFMKKWGKNQKKRRSGALGVDFPKRLLQVPSKSVHNLARQKYERTNFHIKPILEQIKYIKVKVKIPFLYFLSNYH